MAASFQTRPISRVVQTIVLPTLVSNLLVLLEKSLFLPLNKMLIDFYDDFKGGTDGNHKT
jgi:hypothetical protein